MEGSPPSETSQTPGAPATIAGNAAPTQPVGSPGDYLEIKTEPMRATLTIRGAIATAGFPITKEDIAKKLAAAQVTYGVDWTAVDKMISGKQYDRGQIIASGTPAKPSRDASIQEKLKIDPNLDPVLGKDGKADYKNVDNIHQVKKGDILAVKNPPVQGEAGSDIFGKPQPATAAKDISFKLGANTEVTADGLQLVASTGGYVYHLAGAINVGITYVLKGDVDFHTGNLHYQGDIQVLGNVTTGFTVEAQGHIIVEGNVDAADVISHGGDVTIKSGVFGHSHGRVSAKGDIHLLGAQDLIIECESGTLHVEKGLRNCTVTARTVKADKPGCTVVGGSIKAYAEVSLASMGGEGCHTEVRLVDKDADAAKARIKEIDKLKAAIAPKIEPVETRLKGMKAMAAKFGGTMSDRSKADLKGVLDQYMALHKAEKDLEEEKERLSAVVHAVPKHIGKFTVTEKLIWGGVLEIYGHHRDLVAEDSHKEWIWSPDGVYGRSLIPETPEKPGDSPAQAAPPA